MQVKPTRRGLLREKKHTVKEIRENYYNALVKSEFRSMNEWARAARIPIGTFFNYSTGHTMPRIDTAITIAMVAGCSPFNLYRHLFPKKEKVNAS